MVGHQAVGQESDWVEWKDFGEDLDESLVVGFVIEQRQPAGATIDDMENPIVLKKTEFARHEGTLTEKKKYRNKRNLTPLF